MILVVISELLKTTVFLKEKTKTAGDEACSESVVNLIMVPDGETRQAAKCGC